MFVIDWNVKKQAHHNIFCMSKLLHVCCLFLVLSLTGFVV